MARRSSSSTTPTETHNVFLSFHHEDTRKTFTSHLNSAIRRLGIKTYIDDNLERGNELSQALLRAIEDAKISVIIFSKNYATSKWCLDEVVKILECRKHKGQIILPVFYDVDSSHVRHQLGSYAEAFCKHEERFKSQMKMVQKWRDALNEVANHSGWDCSVSRMESELVEQIAMDVLQKLDSKTSGGLERRIAAYRLIAQQKLEKSLRTGIPRDMEDLVTTLHQLAELKLEKAMRSDDSTVWEDLMATYERILQIKKDKWMRTLDQKDGQDYTATLEHVSHIEREQSNRMMGFRGI